jgi:hypothetical protein
MPRGSGLNLRSPDSTLLQSGALIVVLVAFAFVNPVGYIGGGWDDFQYVNAARCWVTHGPCLPHDHWQARWPLVAPVALTLRIFGESRTSAAVVPLIYSVVAILSLRYIGERLFSRAAGWIAAVTLAATPVFTVHVFALLVDIPELALMLAGSAALLYALPRHSQTGALLAGACFGLSFATRETAAGMIVLILGSAWLAHRREATRMIAWVVIGIALIGAVETAVYWWATGDPLWRFRLALGHVRIWSSELQPWVDQSRGPLLNPDYIAGWKREPGIYVAWPIDAWLNLLANPNICLTILLGLGLPLVYWNTLTRSARRALGLIGAIAVLHSCFLIYVLAIDPKPRMFLVAAVAGSLSIGVSATAAIRSGRVVIAAPLVVLCGILNLCVTSMHLAVYPAEPAVRQWLRAHPGEVETDPTTRAHFTLLREARQLPAMGSGHRYVLYRVDHPDQPGGGVLPPRLAKSRVVTRTPLGRSNILPERYMNWIYLFDTAQPTTLPKTQ